jgi:hypothetical protein
MKQKTTHTLHMVVDSSVYRQDYNFTSSNLKQLIELGKLGLITIHIPWFIYRECTSGFTHLLSKEIDSSLTAIDKFNSQIQPFGKLKHIVDQKEELLKIQRTIEDSVSELWLEFIKDSKAQLIEFDNSKAKNVFENYFKGNSPFSSLKNRADIPDAFIFQELETISKFKSIHFISDDTNLLKEVKKLKNITVHKGLDAFYNSSHYIPVRKEYESIELYTEAMRVVLGQEGEIIEITCQRLKENKPKQTFEDVYLSSINNEGILMEVENIRKMKILKANIKYIDNTFYLPIEAEADCIVDYFQLKSGTKKNNTVINLQTQDFDDIFDSYSRIIPLVLNFEVKVNVGDRKSINVVVNPFFNKIKIDFDLHFHQNRMYQ